MISKVISVYQERGLVPLLAAVMNFFLSRIFGVHLTKSRSIGGKSSALAVFKNRKLKESNDGYFYLDPMPSEEELTHYYSNVYWDSRSGKGNQVSCRELVHYHLLKKFITFL